MKRFDPGCRRIWVVDLRSDGWELRWRAAALPAAVDGRRLAGGEPKLASKPPFRTGRAPKGRGRLEELTGSLGREVEAPVEEIDSEGGRWGSGSGEASGSAHTGEERGGSGAGGLGDGARLLYRAEGQAGGRRGGGHAGGHH
jgi:hypothetical protein